MTAPDDSPTVRVVTDPYPTVGASRCLNDRGDALCWREKGHDGDCEPLPVPGMCCCGVRLSTWSPPTACCCGRCRA